MNLAVYISGHGFGHLAQIAPILKQIHHIKPECRFFIRCALPEQEIRSQLNIDFELNPAAVDVGVIQKNAVQEDRDTSIQCMRKWIDQFDAHIAQEIAWLDAVQATLVLSNISPLAFPAAKAFGIGSIAIATLDWHTIYSHWMDAEDHVIRTLAKAYNACDLLLTPPMAMHMPAFPTQRNIALIVSQPSSNTKKLPPMLTSRHDPRHKALVLFGGCGNPPYDMHGLANMPDWLFFIPDISTASISPMQDHLQPIHFNADLRPVDVMPYIDVVVCKPGYGVLSDCWATATAIAWLERPDFPEFPMLKTWLDDSFPAAGMSRDDFQCGAWRQALETALTHPTRFPKQAHDGDRVAADIIVSFRPDQ